MMQSLNNRINVKLVNGLVAVHNVILNVILNNAIVNHFYFPFTRNRHLYNIIISSIHKHHPNRA